MKKYQKINVYEATKKRLKYLFEEFDQIIISFSGGKDSGVMLNMAIEYAKENNLISSNIVDYLIGNQWDQHIKLMTGEDKTTSITFDTTELL